MVRFFHCDFFFHGIDDKDHIRRFFHISDTAEVVQKFLFLSLQHQCFFFGQKVHLPFFFHLLDNFEFFDRFFNCLEVCEHTAEPSVVDIRHTATFRILFDCVGRLFFRTYEKNRFPFRCRISDDIVCISEISKCFLQIDDVDIFSLTENVRFHLRIPSSCLVSEVYTALE